MAIDVEDLLPDQLTGSGLAKALLRAMPSHRDVLLEGLATRASLDLRDAMPFVELHFQASTTVHAYLKGRSKLVDPALFEPHRQPRDRD